MHASTRPGKEAARAYLVQRMREHTPPPPLSEVRRRLGWALVKPFEPSDTFGTPPTAEAP
jgi:hypothetical protein